MALSSAHVYGSAMGNDAIQSWLPTSEYLKASVKYLFCAGPLGHRAQGEWTGETLATAADLYATGLPLAAVAARYGVDPQTKLWSVISDVGDRTWATTAIGVGWLVLIFAIQRFAPKTHDDLDTNQEFRAYRSHPRSGSLRRARGSSNCGAFENASFGGSLDADASNRAVVRTDPRRLSGDVQQGAHDPEGTALPPRRL